MKNAVLSGRCSRPLNRIVLACLVLVAAALFAGCGGSGSAPATSFATRYAGNWSGTWTDISGTSGTSTMVITLTPATKAASVSIALSGDQFGFAGSQAALTGTYDLNSITVSGPTNTAASVSLVIAKSGQFTGTFTNLSATVSSVTFSGPSTPQSVTLNVVLHHTDGTTDSGTVTLTKSTTTT